MSTNKIKFSKSGKAKLTNIAYVYDTNITNNILYNSSKEELHRPLTQKEYFRQLCLSEDGEETVLRFYPYKVLITYTQEIEIRKLCEHIVNFDEYTIRLRKGKGSALYFRFMHDAILVKMYINY